VPGGFTNSGTIELSNIAEGSSNNVTLEATGGVITNAAGGTILSLPGPTGAGNRTINARLVHAGTISVQHPLTLNDTAQGNQFTVMSFDSTSGTINIAADKTLTIQSSRSAFGSGTVFTGGGTFGFSGTAQLDLASDFTLGTGAAIVSTTQQPRTSRQNATTAADATSTQHGAVALAACFEGLTRRSPDETIDPRRIVKDGLSPALRADLEAMAARALQQALEPNESQDVEDPYAIVHIESDRKLKRWQRAGTRRFHKI
jgi:hypothetical protein